MSLVKLSIVPGKKGWTLHAHYVSGRGKEERISTDVYACESVKSVVGSVRPLLTRMERPTDGSDTTSD